VRISRRGILREWSPAILLAALALLSVQVLRSSYDRWQDVLEQTVTGLENVSESRRRLLRSYLIDQRQAEGDPTFERASARAEAAASANALSNWFTGRSTVAGLRSAPPDDPALIAPGRAYEGALADFREALAVRPPDPIRRRRTFSAAEQAASALESAVYADLLGTVQAERRLYRLRLAAWGALLLLSAIGIVYARSALRRAEAGRARSESRLSRLRAIAPVAIIECDTEARIHAANVMWSTLTGRSEEAWSGLRWWEALDPSEHDRARALWAESVRSGTANTDEFLLAPSDASPDERWVLTRTAPASGHPAEAGRWVVTFTDITTRRRAEEQLRHAQRLEAVGRLAGGVAHDFNNLLTSIGGFATLAREAVPARDPVYDDLVEIERGAERGRALTRQLLTFSRQERIRLETLDVGAVVRELEKMLNRLVREDIELVIVTGTEPAVVRADRGQVEQVITNLVINAGDAMPGGGRIRIGISRAEIQDRLAAAKSEIPPGHYVLLSVADTGTGIPPSIRERIFEPFFTTKEQGKGTGLGLSTVWGIVRQSGGHIHLYSEEGRGTVFKIYLPATDAPAAAHVAEPRPSETGPTPGGTILVVEDQEAVRRLIARVLQRRGWTVLEASDGNEALDLLDRHPDPVDLLITDVIMRGMGGPELVERLRARGATMPALFVSGYSDSELPLAEAHFLEKPFSPDDLVKKVREVLPG
jgi:two-component system cell cycle sensor histidine kinase/response regulator CckA